MQLGSLGRLVSNPMDKTIMLTYSKIGEYVDAEPFRPFRIKMASGQSFEIRHPEMIMVGRSSAKIYKSSESNPDGPQFWQEISLMLT
jgi:hypothetical protein